MMMATLLSDRIDASRMTAADITLLDSFPVCELSPLLLVRLFAEIEREF